MINFIKNLNYNFIFCINSNIKLFQNYSNVKIYSKLNTNELMKIVINCKYILCRKYPYQYNDRFTGAISIGLSHNIPMILQNEINKIYNIPCLNFNINYSEILPIIINNNDIKYNILKKNIIIFKKNKII